MALTVVQASPFQIVATTSCFATFPRFFVSLSLSLDKVQHRVSHDHASRESRSKETTVSAAACHQRSERGTCLVTFDHCATFKFIHTSVKGLGDGEQKSEEEELLLLGARMHLDGQVPHVTAFLVISQSTTILYILSHCGIYSLVMLFGLLLIPRFLTLTNISLSRHENQRAYVFVECGPYVGVFP